MCCLHQNHYECMQIGTWLNDTYKSYYFLTSEGAKNVATLIKKIWHFSHKLRKMEIKAIRNETMNNTCLHIFLLIVIMIIF